MSGEILVVVVAVGIVIFVAWWLGRRGRGPTTVVITQGTRRPRQRTERPKTDFEVVGESYRQTELETICGGRTEDEADFPCEVTLVPEPSNPVDRNAVRVEVAGIHVGYLSKKSAADYQPIAAALGRRQLTAPGRIVGGWSRGPNDWGHYGVLVELPGAAELLGDVQAGQRETTK